MFFGHSSFFALFSPSDDFKAMDSHPVSSPYCALAEDSLSPQSRRQGDCLGTNHTKLG